ncbi:MAG: MYXO-CTERM sorting domain-containing protein [Kofleriaceae bacterium]
MSALFVVAMGCGNFGSCGACGAVQPLPGGKLPSEQTIEGGAQVRVTQAGFTKLSNLLATLLNQQLAGGFCIPEGEVGGCSTFDFGGCYCMNNDGGCNPGCRANVSVNSINVSVTSNSQLRLTVSAGLNASIPIRIQATALISGSCTLNVSSQNINGTIDLDLGINPSNGELTLDGTPRAFGLNLSISGCGFAGQLLQVLSDIIDDIAGSFLGQFLFAVLDPVVDDLLDQLLPSPLGIAGMMDMGNLLSGVSPGTEALMEARIVPGGYVRLDGAKRALSLGIITGMNADEDITTRTGQRPDGIPLASEPNLCVPPMSPPAFGSTPHNLGAPPDNPARGTFFLPAAGAFDGNPEPQADLAMGVSETFLDLAGHHLVTSGAMCLGVGTTFINQLNVGTIGILVPSLAELTSDTGKDPLLLVTRPQKPVDFTIGDNTPTSPALTLGIQNLEVDFYAFLFERYVRAFTLDLSMNVGVNLEFEQMPGMPAQIKPTLIGISSSTVQVKVLNSEFVRETPQHLEMVLPSVFDLVTPLLGNIGTIQVPDFAGFSLNQLSIAHITTPNDDFLALQANLGSSTLMKQIAQTNPFAMAQVNAMDAEFGPSPQSTAVARLKSVTTPSPEKLREAMTKGGPGMPEVVFEADKYDATGRELEYSYELNGGMARPFMTPDANGHLVIRDPAFAWQGKYTIGIKSRAKGDYRSTSAETTTKVIIDSVGPKISLKKMEWVDSTLRIPMFDIVSEHAIQYAFGKTDSTEPSTPWTRGSTAEITKSLFDDLAIDGEVMVYAKDEAGNVEYGVIEFHGQASSEGCSCETGSGPSKSGVALALFVGIVMFGGKRRRRRVARSLRRAMKNRYVANGVAFLSMAILTAFLPACDCGDPGAKSCELASDCGPDFCEQGQLPFCIDGECVCSDDIIAGRVGPYSDVAAGVDGSIWVSGYSINHGDLVVAKADGPGRIPVEKWEYVDGVPDGPVLIPDSKIRGGIDASGEDVGMWTSIQVNSAGEPMVTYFDKDTSSLRFAHKVGDTWQKHVIQQGSGEMLGEQDGLLAGMFTSLTLRSDDGRPGVAYLALVKDTQGARAEVRYAAAQTPNPTSSADWMLFIVDSAPLPPEDPENPNVYPLPDSLGLFVDSARLPNQAPVVVYYDRVNGDLKMSKFNPQSGQFGVAQILDGAMNKDAGWSPSISIDTDGMVNVAYVAATKDDLTYLKEGGMAEIVDDGYRIVGTTVDGLPKPEFHFVGDDASLQMVGGTVPWVVYQDSTTQELLLGTKQQDGSWSRTTIAGGVTEGEPWPGAYGFYASSSLRPTEIVISTWVINQPADNPFEDNWVEIFIRPTTIQ